MFFLRSFTLDKHMTLFHQALSIQNSIYVTQRLIRGIKKGAHTPPFKPHRGDTDAYACGICDVTQRTVIKSQRVNDIRTKPHQKQSITRDHALIVSATTTS